MCPYHADRAVGMLHVDRIPWVVVESAALVEVAVRAVDDLPRRRRDDLDLTEGKSSASSRAK